MVWTGTKRDQRTSIGKYILRVKQIAKGHWWWIVTGELITTNPGGKLRRDQKKLQDGHAQCRKVALQQAMVAGCKVSTEVRQTIGGVRKKFRIGGYLILN